MNNKYNSKECLICNKNFKTIKARNIHVYKYHNITFEEYIVKFFYNDIQPVCKCGCGTKLKFYSYRHKK